MSVEITGDPAGDSALLFNGFIKREKNKIKLMREQMQKQLLDMAEISGYDYYKAITEIFEQMIKDAQLVADRKRGLDDE